MFGRKKENEVKVLISEHLEKVSKTVEKMTLSVQDYIKGNIDDAKENGYQTHLVEKEADEKRRTIIEKLHKGAFLPVFREDLIKLVAQQDKIADRAESCCDFCLTQRPEIPGKFRKKFEELLSASVETFKPYKEALEQTFISYDIMKVKIKEVNTEEEKADTVEWHITRDIFTSDMPLAQKIHLRDLVFHIVCISDIIEDAADDLDIFMVKYRM
ncbi:MAG: TIGR00153 family protein [bacterium]